MTLPAKKTAPTPSPAEAAAAALARPRARAAVRAGDAAGQGSASSGVPADTPPLRRMRGPSPEKTALTRSEIVTAAIAEFMAEGINKATMDKIAKRAKVAKGTVYLHFGSKEDLLRGALEVTFRESALPALRMPRREGESMHAYISRLAIPPMERFHDSVRADLARLVLGEARRFPVLGQIYYEKIFLPWHTHFEMLFQQAIDEGELHGVLPATASRLLGAPFWMYLTHDSLNAPVQVGCRPADLAKGQIDAIFGRFVTDAAAKR